ncbi:MAG TPA: EAL domain-containing protein [Bradyrhizobium sp.]|nr:EAL domain-containing protein [Bradyrhizobium sp.]
MSMETSTSDPSRLVNSSHTSSRLIKMFAALSAANEAILRVNSREKLFQEVCEAALNSGNFITAVILLREPNTDVLKAVAGAGDYVELSTRSISVSAESPLGNGLVGIAFRTQKPCVSNDLLRDDRLKSWHEAASRAGARAAAALPVVRAGESVGVIVVVLDEIDALDEATVALLARMAKNLSFGLDNIEREEACKRNERAARRLAKMFAALSATNEAILRAKSAEELYQLACDAAVHIGRSLAATVLLAQEGSSWLHAVAGTGQIVDLGLVRQSRFSTDSENPYGMGVCGRAFRTQKANVNDDILNSEQGRPWRESSREAGVVASCAVPLIKGGQSVGVILFFITKSLAADDEIVALFSRMGENISAALENLDRANEKLAADKRIEYLATHDELTDLPNRVSFRLLFEQSIKTAQRHRHKCALLFIDLDRFKVINDSLGHEAGDALLVEVANRLKACIRGSDLVARFGGDEFVIVLNEVFDQEQITAAANKVLSVLLPPIVLAGHECLTTGSIGIAVFPDNGEDVQVLTKNADMAMYLAKEEGRNNFRFFSSDAKSQSIEQLKLETHLRHGLELDQFTLHYQPKIEVATGRISGFEALLRWSHPALGNVPPAEFIPLTEETGLIIPIGRWVLRNACAQIMSWQAAGLPAASIAVNLSPRQFMDPNLLDDIDDILASTGLPAHLLQLEITESAVMRNVEQAIKLLDQISSRGVRLAIDDFGTGYSSMSLMKKFPIDTIKIDRSFVSDLEHCPEDQAIVAAIISMGKALGLTVVAEGVETSEQHAFLRRHACDEVQGYLFSKPLPPDEITPLFGPSMSSPSLQPELSGMPAISGEEVLMRGRMMI